MLGFFKSPVEEQSAEIPLAERPFVPARKRPDFRRNTQEEVQNKTVVDEPERDSDTVLKPRIIGVNAISAKIEHGLSTIRNNPLAVELITNEGGKPLEVRSPNSGGVSFFLQLKEKRDYPGVFEASYSIDGNEDFKKLQNPKSKNGFIKTGEIIDAVKTQIPEDARKEILNKKSVAKEKEGHKTPIPTKKARNEISLHILSITGSASQTDNIVKSIESGIPVEHILSEIEKATSKSASNPKEKLASLASLIFEIRGVKEGMEKPNDNENNVKNQKFKSL